MKKALAVIVTVCVVLAAGSAFAHVNQQQANHPNMDFRTNGEPIGEHRNQQLGNHPGMMNFQCQPDGNFDGRGPRQGFGGHCRNGRRGMNFTPDMPKEIREKAAELAKLRIDLEEAMSSDPINKAKALDTHAKMQKLKQEIEAWRFAQKLERIEEFRKQMKLNREVPPAPMKKEEAKDAAK